MVCKVCGGTMHRNEKKVLGSKMPDWICDQAIRPCMTPSKKDGTLYPTGAWDPPTIRTTAVMPPPAPVAPVAQPNPTIQPDRLQGIQLALERIATALENQPKKGPDFS